MSDGYNKRKRNAKDLEFIGYRTKRNAATVQFIREVERQFLFRWITDEVVKSEAEEEFRVLKLLSECIAGIYSVACRPSLRAESFEFVIFIAVKRIVRELA